MPEAPWPPEPKITVNGRELMIGEAMTMRVALETFMLHLSEMPQDELRRGYEACVMSIRTDMYRR